MDNSAAVTGKGPQDQSVVDTATDSVPAVQSPAIEITKLTMDGATLGDGINILVGETIGWSFVVTNKGNVTLPM